MRIGRYLLREALVRLSYLAIGSLITVLWVVNSGELAKRNALSSQLAQNYFVRGCLEALAAATETRQAWNTQQCREKARDLGQRLRIYLDGDAPYADSDQKLVFF